MKRMSLDIFRFDRVRVLPSEPAPILNGGVVFQIGWLMDRFGPALTADIENAEARKILDGIVLMASELVRRVSATRFRERSDLCKEMLQQARKAAEEKDPQHIDLLAHLVQAERRAFGVDTGTAPVAAAR